MAFQEPKSGVLAIVNTCSSVKHIPVKRAVLDGLQQVRLLDAVAAREVGDGAGDFQDAVVGAGGQRELLHRLLEHFPERGVERDMGADLRVAHAGVGRELRPGEAGELAFAGGLYPRTYDRRTFARCVVLQLADGKRGGLDVDVDAVEQRAADPRPVFDYL
jgi:hypothetical protein